jgi:hypothetical protein
MIKQCVVCGRDFLNSKKTVNHKNLPVRGNSAKTCSLKCETRRKNQLRNARYALHPDKHLNEVKEAYWRDPDKVRARERKRRQDNIDEIRAYDRKRRPPGCDYFKRDAMRRKNKLLAMIETLKTFGIEPEDFNGD